MGGRTKTKMASVGGMRRGLGSGSAIRTSLLLLRRTTKQSVAKPSFSTSSRKLGGNIDDWYYRTTAYADWQLEWMANGFAFIIYWWFFHNFMYDPGHILGAGAPTPENWTDEELGIPPDDA